MHADAVCDDQRGTFRLMNGVPGEKESRHLDREEILLGIEFSARGVMRIIHAPAMSVRTSSVIKLERS
jgi:hypothetical protein